MWQVINRHLRHKSNTNPRIEFPNLNELNDYFSNLGPNTTKHLKNNLNYRKYLTNPIEKSIFLTHFIESEIIGVVTALPPKKSCGHDNISILLIKSVINTIAKPLCAIFNQSFLTGQFPSYLKIARIIPIYKSGEKIIRVNYRPISILSSFSKIIEKLMRTHLMLFLNSNNKLHSSQYGFCSSHNVTTAILDVLNSIH